MFGLCFSVISNIKTEMNSMENDDPWYKQLQEM